MTHGIQWRQLGPGLVALATIVVLAAGVLSVGRAGPSKPETFRLYVATSAARGVSRGSEVWLDGQPVGSVTRVSFLPPSAAAAGSDRLVLALDVRRSEQAQIRLDSRARVAAGATPLGDRVLYLRSGTPHARAVRDGDTLRMEPSDDSLDLLARMTRARRDFPGIVENVTLLSATLEGARGTLGALGAGDDAGAIRGLRTRVQALSGRLTGANGLPRARQSAAAVTQQVSLIRAQMDSIRQLVTSDRSSLGRFRRDSSLVTHVTRLHGELARIRTTLADPSDLVGRARTDSAIVRAVARDLAEIDSLRADMKRHPFRYIVLF